MSFRSIWKKMSPGCKRHLEKQTGVSFNYLSQVANGREPSIIFIRGLSQILDIPEKILFPNINIPIDIIPKDSSLKKFKKRQLALPV